MTEALLRWRLASVGVGEATPVRTCSAGLAADGEAPPAELVSVIARYGMDISRHRSRALSREDVLAAELIVAMTRDHVREIAVLAPAAWPRTFTLKELVRRGELIGPRQAGESLADWIGSAHAGRDRTTLLGDSADDDLADPFSGPLPGYVATVALVDDLLSRLVGLCWPAMADAGRLRRSARGDDSRILPNNGRHL